MVIELFLLDKIKARIQLARQIDIRRHKVRKENHEKQWLKNAAEAMEIELDSDLALRYVSTSVSSSYADHTSSSDEGDAPVPGKHHRKSADAKTTSLRAELKALLAQPLLARGVSTRYVTSGSRAIVDDFIAGQGTSHVAVCGHTYRSRLPLVHSTMIGLKNTQAGEDLVAPKRKKKIKPEAEEWSGIS